MSVVAFKNIMEPSEMLAYVEHVYGGALQPLSKIEALEKIHPQLKGGCPTEVLDILATMAGDMGENCDARLAALKAYVKGMGEGLASKKQIEILVCIVRDAFYTSEERNFALHQALPVVLETNPQAFLRGHVGVLALVGREQGQAKNRRYDAPVNPGDMRSEANENERKAVRDFCARVVETQNRLILSAG